MQHKHQNRYLGSSLSRKDAGGADIKTGSVEEIKSALDKIGGQVKEAGEKALAEAQKGVQMSTAAKEKTDELLSKQGELEKQLKEAVARLDDVEQNGARGNGQDGLNAKSVGNQFVDSEGFKKFAGEKGAGKFSMNFKAVTDITSATTGTGAAGDWVQRQRVESRMVTPGLRRLTIRDLIAQGRTNSNSVEYVQESGFQNMAAVQATEGSAKAQSDIAFTDANSAVATIAHWVRTSKQILSDAPRLQSYIDNRMRYGLKLVEENQILMGSGTSGNLNGIYTQATAYSAPAGGYGGGSVGATPLDILRLAILQAELAEYPIDGIVINPTQWAFIETLKDSEGRYIIGNPQGALAPTVWNRDVVATTAMTTDKFLVGAFGMGAEVFDREDAAVLVSTEDGDNFRTNRVTILAEERLALAVYRTEAFIKGDLGTIS